MPQNAPVTIGFQIEAIHVTSFTMTETPLANGDEVGFGLRLQHLFDAEHDTQIVRVAITVSCTENDPPLIELHLDCQYQLTGYRNWLASQPGNHQQAGILPTGLAVTLNSISISTARGVLYERLRGSALQDVILPIVDPSSLQVLEQ